MTSPTELLVDAAAAYRLTRLLVDDEIAEPLRERLFTRARMRQLDRYPVDAIRHPTLGNVPPPFVERLLSCRWCTGVWVGAAVVVARRLAGRRWHVCAEALTLAAAAALAERLEA